MGRAMLKSIPALLRTPLSSFTDNAHQEDKLTGLAGLAALADISTVDAQAEGLFLPAQVRLCRKTGVSLAPSSEYVCFTNL